jgi:hypothetical protein
MIKYENHCCDCATPSYPCLGSLCPLIRVPVHYCDECGEELDDVYKVDDEELCEGCLKERFLERCD